MKDSELRQYARDLEMSLYVLNLDLKEFEKKIMNLQKAYKELDEEEADISMYTIINQIYSTMGINTMYSEKRKRKVELKELYTKLLEDENTFDNKLLTVIPQIIVDYRTNLDTMNKKLQDEEFSDIDMEDILGTPGSKITFKASDGKEFETQAETIIHNLEVSDELRENLESRENNGRSRTR